MVDVKEGEGASKSNSSPHEDAAPMVLTPTTVSTTSKDEGDTMVVPEIDQLHNKQEASMKVETNGAQAIKEDAVIRKDEEKTEEHIKVENLGVNLKGKGMKPRKRNKKKVARKTSEVVAANNGLMIKETHGEVAVKEAEEKTEEKNSGDKLLESSNGRGRKPRRNRAKKVAEKGSDMVVADEGKPESYKKVESMGMVFMCNSKTKADCFQYKILGLPAGKKDQVAKIYKGMRLFLYDVDLRLMYGIFKAAGEGGYNIEPKAFKSAFPSQVRFTVMEDCLPLAEEKFRKVIKENYYSRNKFHCQLNAQQVKKLCNLFVTCKSDLNPKKAITIHQSGADAYTARDRKKHKRQPHPHPREQRRYHEYGQPPIEYQREILPSPVSHVAKYLPHEVAPVRSYRYEVPYPYARDPMLKHRPYHVLDTDNHRQLYSREEAPIYHDDVYPSVDQMMEYHHHQPPVAATLLSEYHLVNRKYPQPEEYHHHISRGGLQVRGYDDVGQYFPSSAARTRYRY